MVLVDEQTQARAPWEAPKPQHRHKLHVPRRLLAVLAVIVATLTGGYLALVTFHQERTLSVGAIRLSVSPGHRGALDLYVPLVDWGARFEAIRLPARLRVDLRTVDRSAVAKVAGGGSLDVHDVRVEARDAIASYLRALIGVVLAAGLALGLLVALAVRGGPGPPLKVTLSIAAGTAVASAIAIALLLPPRGAIENPQYYAHGPDIPGALQAVEAVQRSGAVLDQELDAQLVGLARLVAQPGERTTIAGRPDITVASDLHNNTLGISILARNSRGPVFFVGDLTDRGSPLETRVTERIVHTGHPFVFVSGNHDSDSLSRKLAREGAIVLTQFGRLKPEGGYGPVVVKIAGLRVAGYSDPFERLSAEDFADRFDNAPTLEQQAAFTTWLRRIEDQVDVVMVHEPALIGPALRGLAEEQPDHPIVFLVGHTHTADLQRFGNNVTMLNSGSIGAGGSGNLTEHGKYGLGRLVYDAKPTFEPLAADLITIDPGTGSSTARRDRLDEPVAP